jgi:hypothetical protein
MPIHRHADPRHDVVAAGARAAKAATAHPLGRSGCVCPSSAAANRAGMPLALEPNTSQQLGTFKENRHARHEKSARA